MGSCKDSKQMELYKILKKTKFDHTNKALMTYYSSGLTPKLQEFFIAILYSNIPLKDVKPLSLILYNRARNGSSVTGYERLGIRAWQDRMKEDPAFVYTVHSLTRRSTIERWREAITLIDKAKKNK